MPLFWKVLETLGGEVYLKEVGHWVTGGIPFKVIPGLPALPLLPQLPVCHEVKTLCHMFLLAMVMGLPKCIGPTITD